MEKAEQNIKGADAERMAQRMLANKFDFNDFMDQSRMMGQMGSMGQMMKMIPGAQLPPSCVFTAVSMLRIAFDVNSSSHGSRHQSKTCRCSMF